METLKGKIRKELKKCYELLSTYKEAGNRELECYVVGKIDAYKKILSLED